MTITFPGIGHTLHVLEQSHIPWKDTEHTSFRYAGSLTECFVHEVPIKADVCNTSGSNLYVHIATIFIHHQHTVTSIQEQIDSIATIITMSY